MSETNAESTPVPEARICANCACYLERQHATNPLEKQGFCRRNGAQYGRMRVSVPRLDADKKPVLGKDKKPIMENAEQEIYLYQPMAPGETCFDGWRPEGTLPGERLIPAELQKLLPVLFELLQASGGGKRVLSSKELKEVIRGLDGPPI